MSNLYWPSALVLSFFREQKKFLIFGHVEPDGDSVASQLALCAFLRRIGKQALPFSEGPFDRPEIRTFEHLFSSRLSEQDLAGTPAAVVLDCSTAERIGRLAESISGLPTLVIDHHASGGEFGDVRWVLPQAPSVTFLIQHLIEAYDGSLKLEEAELILFGLARDTGFFRHLGDESAPVFEAVARLVAAGASPRKAYRMTHCGWQLRKVKLLAASLRRAQSALEGRVLVTWQTLANLRSADGELAARGSDEVYRILQGVQGVEVVAFLQEEEGGRCSVGLRSNSYCDVGRLARSRGGGGHAQAAGYTAPGGLAETREDLLRSLRALLDRTA